MLPSALRLVVAALLLCSSAAAQPTLNVPSPAYPTIQIAINLAPPGATVLVGPGTWQENLNFLGKAITVAAAQGPTATALRGNFVARVVTFSTNEGPASVLDGFTIRDGNGGILIQNASPTIRNCVIRNNVLTTSPSTGGGIRILATSNGTASPLISQCTLLENLCSDPFYQASNAGGGLSCQVDQGSQSFFSMVRCSVIANYVPNGGGGMFVSGGSAGLIDCSITDNVAGQGGGILGSGSALTMASCRVERNSAGTTGGLYASFSTLSLSNCMITGNTANEFGGAQLSCANGTVSHSTIAGNGVSGAASFLGGISLGLFNCSSSTYAFIHSVVWGNDGIQLHRISANCAGGTITPVVTATRCDLGFSFITFGASNLSVDPLFVDPARGDFHLSAASPCRDAGDPAATNLPLFDMDGTARLVGAAVDLGADEVPVPALPGTGEDLGVFVWASGGGDPEASMIAPAAGQIVRVGLASPGGSFTGTPALLLAQVFSSVSPPAPVPGHPALHIDVAAPFGTLFGSLAPAPFPAPGLPSSGIFFETQAPAGLAGTSVRLQGFAFSSLAGNTLYAATSARVVVLP